jgi:formylglycine-generating enzyme required for sulfatase activity
MLYDLMGNAREWCVEPYRLPHTGKTPAAASRADSSIRVVRGLPLKPEVDGRVSSAPVVGAAWRMPLCGHGACLQEKTLTGESVTSALAEVGFRCVRPPASPEPGKAPGR